MGAGLVRCQHISQALKLMIPHPPITLAQPAQEVPEVPERNLKTAPKTKPHSKKKTSWWPF